MSTIKQDSSPQARSYHLKKLPKGLLSRVKNYYDTNSGYVIEKDESAYWVKLAGDDRLQKVITQEMAGIVRRPATVSVAEGYCQCWYR
ncbi:hypothetical protein MPER_00818 [Moniliophthora perniciosa FA553]|nr:hypothetical protein MPER_00818 [Moniliophthora perniciosa FA553]